MWRALFKPPPSTSASTSTSISASNIPSSSNNPHPHHPHHGASSSSTSGSASISASNIPSSSNNPHPHHPHQGGSSSSSVSGSVSSSSNNKKNPYTSKMASFLKRLGRCTSLPIRCLDRKGFLFPRSSSDPAPTDSIPDDVQRRRFSVVLESKDLCKLAVSDKGSQVLINSMNESTAGLIFERISDRIFEVMPNKNGTKVVQCLCKFQSSLTPLALEVLKKPDDLRDVVFHWSGNGSDSAMELLVALNKINSPHTCQLVRSLATLDIMTHSRTEQLIMYCLKDLNSDDNMGIFQCAIICFDNLARNKCGQQILSKLITLGDNPLWDQLLNEICSKTCELSSDPNGSYVIQHVLELKNPHFDELICSQVRDQILPLSKNLYGMFVVKSCLQSKNCMETIVNELLIGQRLYHLATELVGVNVVETAIMETQKNNIVLFGKIERALEQHMKDLYKDELVGRSVYNLLRARQ